MFKSIFVYLVVSNYWKITGKLFAFYNNLLVNFERKIGLK